MIRANLVTASVSNRKQKVEEPKIHQCKSLIMYLSETDEFRTSLNLILHFGLLVTFQERLLSTRIATRKRAETRQLCSTTRRRGF